MMETQTQARERVVKFFAKQFDAFSFTTQFGAAVAGVQSGKTFWGAHWAGKKIAEFPDKNGIIVAPTYKILQAATIKKFFDVCPIALIGIYHALNQLKKSITQSPPRGGVCLKF